MKKKRQLPKAARGISMSPLSAYSPNNGLATDSRFGATSPDNWNTTNTGLNTSVPRNIYDNRNNYGNKALSALNTVAGVATPIVDSISQYTNRKSMLDNMRKHNATANAQMVNAASNMPGAYNTMSGINARNVAKDYESASRDLRSSEAARMDATNRLSGSAQQATQQALRNQTSNERQSISDAITRGTAQERARVDQVNTGIANQNAQIQTQYAKDKTKFENEKIQRLADARMTDLDRELAADQQQVMLDLNDKSVAMQLASSDPRTRANLMNQGVPVNSGYKGVLEGLDISGNKLVGNDVIIDPETGQPVWKKYGGKVKLRKGGKCLK